MSRNGTTIDAGPRIGRFLLQEALGFVHPKWGYRMATAIDVHELPARLEEALARASSGEDVILLDGSTPRARLVPLSPAPPRAPGLHPGTLQATPDFDAPLPEDFWAGHS